ncbi:hypothetical protein H6F78_04500 [Coleofasciculus sp. FACHB-64]|uniref:hypothetical protein n=1 Tax=Cyanophyceae TaxID=3028117 RepID=UPI00168564CD|nr:MULTISPECIES: hypothetical protein [unclassified Coleofasciculus]MBD1840101.1 hypothetical protein [Coleofasciculus sp. FACHB-501]MBD2044900.1 hypothetical protein [Coleofasciculus sp. FACHB-64]
MRYLPLTTLYDGNQRYVQKYRINNITVLSLTKFDAKPQAPKIFVDAFSQGRYNVREGERSLPQL